MLKLLTAITLLMPLMRMKVASPSPNQCLIESFQSKLAEVCQNPVDTDEAPSTATGPFPVEQKYLYLSVFKTVDSERANVVGRE